MFISAQVNIVDEALFFESIHKAQGKLNTVSNLLPNAGYFKNSGHAVGLITLDDP